MSIVLLLQMMEGWDKWGVIDLYLGMGGGKGGGYHPIVFGVFSCAFVLSPFI